MAQPHSSWADVYDLAYEHSFGEFYNQLTEVTIQVIAERVHPPAKIVDFGAGTGRLSIPLAEQGFEVTAVDPCSGMLKQLERKSHQGTLHTVNSKMEDFTGDGSFDMALCVFTVLLYLLDENSLNKALIAAHTSLKPGGFLLIDIPSRAIFSSYSRDDHLIKRTVSVINQTGNIYSYQEDMKVKLQDGRESRYQDTFSIRYWPPELVMKALQEGVGFVLEADLTHRFSGSGSHYYIMKKAEQGAPLDGNSAALPCRW